MSIADDIAAEHELSSVHLVHPKRCNYTCRCGWKGHTSSGLDLSFEEMKARARKNHELHQARAIRRALRRTP